MDDKVITSIQNNKIKQLRSLKQKHSRDELNMFIAEGDKVITDALNAGIEAADLFILDSKSNKFTELINLAHSKNITVTIVNDKVLSSITQTKSPQGSAASFYKKSLSFSYEKVNEFNFVVMLEEIKDPGNLGTIIRTCDAVGVDMVIMDSCTDLYNNKVIRASMGSIFNIPCIEHSIHPLIQKIKTDSWQVGCGHLNGQNFYTRSQSPKVALVIGNEATGVNSETSSMCTDLWKLPMRGKNDYLNASVAAGIMLYDIYNKMVFDAK